MNSGNMLAKKMRIYLLFTLSIVAYSIHAQGIRGNVTDASGEALPFVSIIDMETNRGIASNVEGAYELKMTPGSHRVRFQFLGYRPLDTIFQIGASMTNFSAVMLPEAIELAEATVSNKGEDPAYTIMRRAIAKAKYHSLQVDEYNAIVYVKGSGRLVKVPFLFRKKINRELAKEGIDSTVAFTQESVSKLHYIRPDQYRDTVISIRTSGEDNNTSPMGFVYSSFYEPQVVTGISPLAPDAFLYYRYEYLGFIEDGGQVINKIKVKPRSKGDSVFEGVIYIVDNSWSIHSLDFTTYIWGIQFDIQQQFEEVEKDVWLPVHEIYDVTGDVFGFGFEYRYFAKLNDYDIKLNPDLEVPVIVLDPKFEKEEVKVAEKKLKDQSFEEGLNTLEIGEELSVKQLRKMMREYEHQEIESLPDADTLSISGLSKQVIDSTAYKYDSSYWVTVRPLPLTDYEVKGYQRQDSMALIPPSPDDRNDDTENQDSVTVTFGDDGFSANVKRRTSFKWYHLLVGGRYELSDKLYLAMKAPAQSINFNTVDGFHFGYDVELGNKINKGVNWKAGAFGRYAISREAFNYEGRLKLFGKGWSVLMEGGNQTRQYSYDRLIAPWANSLYTLLFNRNYMKIYEQKFARITYEQKVSKSFGYTLSAFYADRKQLENTTDLIFFDNKNRLYTGNDPAHLAGDDNVFNDHEAIITQATAWVKPFWRYRVQNGAKYKDFSKSPMLTMRYRKGWGADNDPFDLVTAQFDAKKTIGAGSTLSMRIAAGKFLGDDKPKYFHDFLHFPGSQMIGAPANPVSSFRMLDYYLYSTNDEFAYGLFNYQFRHFALTQLTYFKRQGIRENIIFNALISPESNQYAEIGYGINYLFRIVRMEFVTSWQDYKYQNFAFRIGIATDFDSIFGGN